MITLAIPLNIYLLWTENTSAEMIREYQIIIYSNAELWFIMNKPRRKDIILVDFEVHFVGAPSAEPTRNLRRPLGPKDAQNRLRNCTRHLFELSTSPPEIGLHVWGICFAYLAVWMTVRITFNQCILDTKYNFVSCSKNKDNLNTNIQVIWIITSKCVRYCFANHRFCIIESISIATFR